MIDSHCHLAFKGLYEIVDGILEDAKKSMKFVVTSGLTRDFEKTLEIAKKHEGFVLVSLGIHPEDIVEMEDAEIEKNLDFIRSKSEIIDAIGEIGLDYKWVTDAKQIEKCKMVFGRVLDMAEELQLPVVLHSRKAEEDVFKIVAERNLDAVVFHHYSGNLSLAQRIIDKGFYISLPTTTPNSKNLRKIAEKFPMENLLTETDSPFNSPIEGKPNVPQNVKYTLQLVSDFRKMEFGEVEKAIDENASRIFESD